MSPFEFLDYKKYVKERIRSAPRGGRGQLKAMAAALRLPPSSLSLVFSGERELSAEQACGVAAFFQLNELETEYFLTIVELARAGTKELIRALELRLRRIREERHRHLRDEFGAKALESGHAVELSLNDRIEFYSDWYHMAILLTLENPAIRTPPRIARFLGLPLERVAESIAFLIRIRAVSRDEEGLKPLILKTVLRQNDPSAFMYYKSWRLTAANRYHSGSSLQPHEFGTTTAFHTTKEAMFRMRELLIEAFQKCFAAIEGSGTETLGYLNLDLHCADRGILFPPEPSPERDGPPAGKTR